MIFQSTGYLTREQMHTDNLRVWFDAHNYSSYPETGTTWYDAMGTSATGSLVNGPTFSTHGGGSISLDGVNDSIRFSNSQFSIGSGSFSYSFWARLSDTTRFSILFSGEGSNSNYGVIAMNPLVDGLVYYALGNRITDNNLNFGTLWTHIMFVGNGAAAGSRNLKLYRNGVQAGSTYTFDYNFTTTTPWLGMNTIASAENMKGDIAQFALFNKEYTSNEVSILYNLQRARFGI